MIEIIFEHSYADNYYCVDSINVKLDNRKEKERIEKVIKELGLEGQMIYPDRIFVNRIAKTLGIKKEMISIDTNDIDLM